MLASDFEAALMWNTPVCVFLAIFVVTLTVPHWIFFNSYLECCLTMPYYYMQQKVPWKLRVTLAGLNIFMISSQMIAPSFIFYYAWKLNDFYFSAFSSPGFNPLTYDFTPADGYMSMEQFWLNYLVCTQVISGTVLLVAIILIRKIVKDHGYNKMVD